MRYFLVVLFEMVMRFVFSLPRFRIFNAIKSLFLRFVGAKVGKRVVYYPDLWICTGRNLNLGDDVDLAFGVLITTDGGVKIGERALIGYRTQIISSNHRIPAERGRIFGSGHNKGAVIIESDVWIGAQCVILPGVTIGEGSVIAAGSVVSRDIPRFCIAAGIPARVIRERD